MAGYCKSCKHPAHLKIDCPTCGCVRYKDRTADRDRRSRIWIANVEYLTTRKGWVKAPEVRVLALGVGGAAMRALREARVLTLRPGQRVAQTRILLTPIPKREVK